MNFYLLATEPRAQYVVEYTASEMLELFRADQIEALCNGQVVRKGETRYVDMRAAASAVLAAG